MDGEAGLAAAGSAKQYYDPHSIKFVPRAKEQQVAHIDRRGALLRDTVHRVVTQCEAEGLDVARLKEWMSSSSTSSVIVFSVETLSSQ